MKNLLKSFFSSINFKNNLTLKVVSVILAVFFWIFVMDQENPQIERTIYNIPVSYVGTVGNGLYVMNTPEVSVNVTVNGRRNTVLGLSPSNIALTVDLSKANEGENKLKIEYGEGENYSVKSLTVAEVPMYVDRIVSAQKRVQFVLSSDFARDLALSTISLSPNSVLVSGPKSFVEKVSVVQGVIDAKVLTDSTQFEMAIVAIDDQGIKVDGVTHVSTVLASADVVKSAFVPITYKFADETDEGYQLYEFVVDVDKVELAGRVSEINALVVLEANPVVIRGNEEVKGVLEFALPDGVSMKNTSAASYTAKVLKEEDREFEIPISQVDLLGLENNLEHQIINETGFVKLMLRGLPPYFEKNNFDHVRLSANLEGMGEGPHTIVLEVPEFEHLKLVENPVVQVLIKPVEAEQQ